MVSTYQSQARQTATGVYPVIKSSPVSMLPAEQTQLSTTSSSSPTVLISQEEYEQLTSSSKRLIQERTLLHHMARSKGKGGFKNLKPQKTTLWAYVNTNVSGANTILEVNNDVLFNSTFFQDWQAIVDLYDEMKVVKGTLHYAFLTTVAASAVPFSGTASCMVGFDPNLGSPTNVVQPLIQTYHGGPFTTNSAVSNGPTAWLMHKLHFRMPGPLAPISASDIPGSAWIALDGGTAPTLCTIQAVATALGTGGVITFTYYLELDIELKIRT